MTHTHTPGRTDTRGGNGSWSSLAGGQVMWQSWKTSLLMLYSVCRSVIQTKSNNENVMRFTMSHDVGPHAVATLKHILLGQGCTHETAISIPGYIIWSGWRRLSCLLVWISQLNWQDIPSLTRQLFFPHLLWLLQAKQMSPVKLS